MRRIFAHPHVRRHLAQGTKFVICGVLAAIIDFSILYVLVTRNNVSPVIAYIFSAGVPALFVFLFNRHVTFAAAKGNTRGQRRRFVLVYSATFVLNYVLSSSFFLFGNHVLLPLPMFAALGLHSDAVAYAARVLAIGITAVVNYSFSHAFIFKANV